MRDFLSTIAENFLRLTIALAATLVVTAVAAVPERMAPIDQTSIVVRGLPVEPAGNLSSEDGSALYHFWGSGLLMYDSNPFVSDNPEGAAAVGMLLGASGEWYTGLTTRWRLQAEVDVLAYLDEDAQDRNFTGGSIIGDWQREGLQWTNRAQLGYYLIDDPLVESGQQIQRQVFEAGYRTARTGLVSRTEIGFVAAYEDYLEDGAGFTEENRDSLFGVVDVTYYHATAEQSEWFGRFAPSIWTYPDGDDGPFRDGYGFDARGGWHGLISDRTKIRAEVGLAWWFFDSNFGDVRGYGDDDALLAVGSFDWVWNWEEGSEVYAGVWSELSPSNSSNGAWTPGFRVGTIYRLSRRWELEAMWTTDYFRNLGGIGDFYQERLTHQIRAGVNYRMFDGWRLRIYAEETVSDSRADAGVDWDRFRGWIEALFAY